MVQGKLGASTWKFINNAMLFFLVGEYPKLILGETKNGFRKENIKEKNSCKIRDFFTIVLFLSLLFVAYWEKCQLKLHSLEMLAQWGKCWSQRGM